MCWIEKVYGCKLEEIRVPYPLEVIRDEAGTPRIAKFGEWALGSGGYGALMISWVTLLSTDKRLAIKHFADRELFEELGRRNLGY